jgi:hypothetical protein
LLVEAGQHADAGVVLGGRPGLTRRDLEDLVGLGG